MDEKLYLNLGEQKVSVKQTSTGYWYVNELSVATNSVMDGLVLMDRAMSEAEKLLAKYNAKTDKIKTEKTETTITTQKKNKTL